MSHVMLIRIRGYKIHFSFRGKSVIIRALTRDGILEFIPRRVFVNNDSFNLPVGLIEKCVY